MFRCGYRNVGRSGEGVGKEQGVLKEVAETGGGNDGASEVRNQSLMTEFHSGPWGGGRGGTSGGVQRVLDLVHTSSGPGLRAPGSGPALLLMVGGLWF